VEYATLGRSGLKVSRACLGTMNFGDGPAARCDESQARRIIDAFLDVGGNVIDTADVYSGGQSEEIVGRAIATKRESVVLATKGSGHRDLLLTTKGCRASTSPAPSTPACADWAPTTSTSTSATTGTGTLR
jgi:aryl-alcohol dehydrogenase-like predicted oxidoreductase